VLYNDRIAKLRDGAEETGLRKTVYTKDDVVAAGLTLVRRGGLKALSARRVAETLGASTAPVYSNFATMEELADAVKRAAVLELLALTRQHHVEDEFLNMGVGILKFVWDWPELYAALFLEPAREYDPGVDLMDELTGVMSELGELEPLPLDERVIVLKKMAIFTHGLATEICQGCGKTCTLEALVVMLREVGRAVVEDARAGHERPAADRTLLDGLWAPAETPGNSRAANPREETKP
jgi:AcrR family transcriptional regulator